MKKVRVWMEYKGKSEIEVEVEDDFDPYKRRSLESWPNGWLADLDASLVEMSPEDWGIEER